MTNIKKQQTVYREMLEAEGCTGVDCEITKRHIKWRFKTPRGHAGLTTTSMSPSDHRALLNQRSDVRGVIRKLDGEKSK